MLLAHCLTGTAQADAVHARRPVCPDGQRGGGREQVEGQLDGV